MSRFDLLEFEEARKGAGKPGEEAPVRDAPFYIREATGHWLAADYERALRSFSLALEQNSACFDGWLGQVRMLIELGEYEEAQMWADKALEFFPQHPDLFSFKAIAWLRCGHQRRAFDMTDHALSAKGNTAFVWLARAEVLLDMRSNTAEACLNNALAASRNSPIVLLQSGRILMSYGRYMAAIDYLRRAAVNLPKSALACLELGRCQAALGLPEAKMTLNHCLVLRPLWGDPLRALEAYHNRGLLGRIKSLLRRRRKR